MAPTPPAAIPSIPSRHTAEIVTYEGRWFRYEVRRLHGVFVPEKPITRHRTLGAARRSAARWRSRDKPEPTVIEARR